MAGAFASRGGQRGFILVATLAALVVLALLASAIALSVERARDDQAAADQAFQDALDAESTRATVLYLAATQRYTFGGLTVDDAVVLSDDERSALVEGEDIVSYAPTGTEIAMDGTPHQGLGRVWFSLQDDRGRLSINFVPRLLLSRWLEAQGAAPGTHGDLFARLLDYQDADDLVRLNGGESAEYRKLGQPPPPNRTLLTPLELRRVLGWNQALASLSDAELVQNFAISRAALVNVNTAPPEVLATIPGWDAAVAERVHAMRRQRGPYASTLDVLAVAGVPPLDPDGLILFPGETASLSTWSPGGGRIQLEQWQLTPMEDGGRPWRTLYKLSLAQPEDPDELTARRPRAKVFTDATTPDP